MNHRGQSSAGGDGCIEVYVYREETDQVLHYEHMIIHAFVSIETGIYG